MRIFALRILKSWEYELVRFPSEYKIFNISFLSPRMLSSQISRKGFHFLKRVRPFFIFPRAFPSIHFILLSKKQIKNDQTIDTTFNVKRIFVYMLLRLHFRGFRTELRSRIHKKKPTKKSKSNLVARKKNQSKKLRFPQPWDRSQAFAPVSLILLLEFLTTPQDKSGRASGNSIEFSASFQSCTCPVQRIQKRKRAREASRVPQTGNSPHFHARIFVEIQTTVERNDFPRKPAETRTKLNVPRTITRAGSP